MRSRSGSMPACSVYPFCSSEMTRMASRMITSGVGRSASPSPRLMLPGFARSEIFRIMLFSMPRRNGGGWNCFKLRLFVVFVNSHLLRLHSNCLNDLTGHQDVDLWETFPEALLEFFETFLRKLVVSCNDFELRDFNALLSVVSRRSPIWFRE